MRAGKAGEHTAQQGSDILHLLRTLAGRAQRLRMLAGAAKPESGRGMVNQYPTQQHKDPGHIDEKGVIVQQLTNNRNVIQPFCIQTGQGRQIAVRSMEGAALTGQFTQQEGGQTAGKNVQRNADDEFVALELNDENTIEQAKNQTDDQCKDKTHRPAAA